MTACLRKGANPEQLREELAAALKEDPVFRHLRIYFG